MKKIDIASNLASKLFLDVDLTSQMITNLLREINRNVTTESRNVSIRGFGSFSSKVYTAKTNTKVFSNKTEAEQDSPETTFARLQFKPGLNLRNQIKDL